MNVRLRGRRISIARGETRLLAAVRVVAGAAMQVVLVGFGLHMGIKRVPSQRQRERQARLEELAHFAELLIAALRKPRRFGSLIPPASSTIAEMVDQASWTDASLVVELHPGTGRCTTQLLRRLGPNATVIALEPDARRARLLRERHDDLRLRVVNDSPERLAYYLDGRRADVVVLGGRLATTSACLPRIVPLIAGGLAPGGVMLAMDCQPPDLQEVERVFDEVRCHRARGRVAPVPLLVCRRPRGATTSSTRAEMWSAIAAPRGRCESADRGVRIGVVEDIESALVREDAEDERLIELVVLDEDDDAIRRSLPEERDVDAVGLTDGKFFDGVDGGTH